MPQKRLLEVQQRRIFAQAGTPNDYRYRFVYGSNAQPDSEYFDLKSGTDFQQTSVTAYVYLGTGALGSQTYESASGFWYQTSYTYNQNGTVAGELSMAAFPGFPADSSSRRTYTYDTLGRLIEFSSEVYQVPGSPLTWTNNTRIEYEYDNVGQLVATHSWTYDRDAGFVPVRSFDHYYHRGSAGTLDEYEQVTYNSDGTFATRDKIEIFYDGANHATDGFEYAWNGSGYDNTPGYRYTFASQITGVRNLVRGEAPKVYPNPCKDFVVLPAGMELAQVTDLQGRLMRGIVQVEGRVDLGALPPGLYLLGIKGQKPVKILRD
jgi:hypothetical protein